ncbi:MAG: hypothetical protein ACKO8P_04850 [Actinomycetota bacterium]
MHTAAQCRYPCRTRERTNSDHIRNAETTQEVDGGSIERLIREPCRASRESWSVHRIEDGLTSQELCFKGRLEFRCRIGRDARWSKGANQQIILGEFANEISEQLRIIR